MDPCLPTVAASGDCDNTFNSNVSLAVATRTLRCRCGGAYEPKDAERIAYTMSKRLDGALSNAK